MSETTARVSLDDLLAHRRWVRALALRLAADDSAAADLEQDAWLAALRFPPRRDGSPRGWLGAVLRNLARTAARRGGTRRRHEIAATRSREASSPADVVAEAELQARLVRAVLDLPEPYRTTVLLRYFHDLGAAEIAAQSGVPVETVRTRLKRAIARLRERLGAELGEGREAKRGLALGMGGGVAMGAASKIGAAAAVALVALLLWTLGGDAQRGGPTPRPGGAETAAAVRAGTAQRASAPSAAPTESVGATAATVSLDEAAPPPPGHRLRGRVLDGTGAPVPGAVVEGGGRRSTTTAGGEFVLTGLPRGEVQLRAGRSQAALTHAVLVAVPDVEAVDVQVQGESVLATGTVLDDATDAPVAGASVGLSDDAGPGFPSGATDAWGHFRIDDFPAFLLDALVVTKPGYRSVPVRRVTGAASRELRVRRGATVEGTVLSAAGPVAEAEVNLGSPSPGTAGGWQRRTTRTDASGRFKFDGAEAGVSQVHAWARGYYAAPRASGLPPGTTNHREVDVPDAGIVRAELVLVRGAAVEGRVVDLTGAGVGGAVVWALGVKVDADADGRFRLDGIPPGDGVLVSAAAPRRRTSAATVAVHESGTQGVVLELAPVAVVRGTVTARDGRPIEDALVLVVATPARGFGDPARLRGDERTAGPFPVGADGGFEAQLPESATEAFCVVVWSTSHAPSRTPPTALVAGGDAYRVDVTVDAGTTLRGRVEADGRPAPGAFLRIGSAGYGYGMPPVRAVADANGVFEIRHVPRTARPVHVTASLAGWPDVAADVPHDAAGDVVLVLERALDITGVVESRDGAPVARAHVAAWRTRADGAMDPLAGEAPFAFADDTGRFRIAGLRPGRYRLVVTRERTPSPPGEPVQAGTDGVRLVVE